MKFTYDKPISSFAFSFNLRRCSKEHFEAVNGDLRAQLDNAKVTTFTVRPASSQFSRVHQIAVANS